jgi:predicted transcriptional regulator of viral defense system
LKVAELLKIPKRLFGVEDVAEALKIASPSARVAASRYVKQGMLVRLKRDLYALAVRFPSFSEEELFTAANLIQTPSYVSLTSALDYYSLTTQQQRGTVESIALKRTKSVHVMDFVFSYTLIRKDLYSHFELKNGFFIATPEKALADCVYLTGLRRYNCDFDAVDFKKLDMGKVNAFLRKTDRRIKSYWESLCRNYGL